MTNEESKSLSAGERVCRNINPRDCGVVVDVTSSDVLIRWEDGQWQRQAHSAMQNVASLPLSSADVTRTRDPLDAQGDEYEQT